MGTPAEEGGGGKIEMARRGAFEKVGAAMMVHPADADLISMDTVALQELHVQYHGKAAHAAAAPWDGRNALDAAVLGYMNIAAHASTHPADRADPRRVHQGRRQGQHRARRDGDGVDRAVAHHRVAAAAEAAGDDLAGGRGDCMRVHHGSSSGTATPTPT